MFRANAKLGSHYSHLHDHPHICEMQKPHSHVSNPDLAMQKRVQSLVGRGATSRYRQSFFYFFSLRISVHYNSQPVTERE